MHPLTKRLIEAGLPEDDHADFIEWTQSMAMPSWRATMGAVKQFKSTQRGKTWDPESPLDEMT